MSRVSDLKTRIHALNDIAAILGAMKSLAVIETTRVGRMIEALEAMHATVSRALGEFESAYAPKSRGAVATEGSLCLLVGSERGFCGPFNERVIEAYEEIDARGTGPVPRVVVVVGRKLAIKMEGRFAIDVVIDGANSADEIPAVLSKLADRLLPYARYRWTFVHSPGNGAPAAASFPLETRPSNPPTGPAGPILIQVPPELLHAQLLEQHLFSTLNRALYGSFQSENRERLQHMSGALQRIEKDESSLILKLNERRQEEITEELEVLMMNAKER